MNISIIGGAAEARDGLAGIVDTSHLQVAKIAEVLKTQGVDVFALLGKKDAIGTVPSFDTSKMTDSAVVETQKG